MPRASEFLGIVVYMYCHDHMPPHFHAGYKEKLEEGGAAVPQERGEHVRRGDLGSRH
ncbi:DUF4160 domain-containing protein [Chloroflexi bacterium CFX6]|nr:DUF4160 domain-containing protein [Chloroflexi bacterium CFX6]